MKVIQVSLNTWHEYRHSTRWSTVDAEIDVTCAENPDEWFSITPPTARKSVYFLPHDGLTYFAYSKEVYFLPHNGLAYFDYSKEVYLFSFCLSGSFWFSFSASSPITERCVIKSESHIDMCFCGLCFAFTWLSQLSECKWWWLFLAWEDFGEKVWRFIPRLCIFF